MWVYKYTHLFIYIYTYIYTLRPYESLVDIRPFLRIFHQHSNEILDADQWNLSAGLDLFFFFLILLT